MSKLSFQHYSSRLQCHMILKFLIIINVEKSVLQLRIFVETVIKCFRIIWWRKSLKTAFEIEIFCNIINVLTLYCHFWSVECILDE